jgi:hypothetical protein
MTIYKDYFGIPLEMNDLVAVEQPKYRNLVTAKVVGFTPKQVRLQYYYQGYWRNYLCPASTTIRAPDNMQPIKEEVDNT